ncbi:TPA: hypothetical protein DCZ50_03205 [Candidatus Nomurabacteria bacterium]|nr:hypothetical protein [Candidatus Nomurabacteria bacterium]
MWEDFYNTSSCRIINLHQRFREDFMKTLLLLVFASCYCRFRYAKRAKEAVLALGIAQSRLSAWGRQNPRYWIGDSEEGREILGEFKVALLDFLDFYPSHEGDRCLGHLLEIMDSGDDEPPSGERVPNKGPHTDECPFSFVLRNPKNVVEAVS